jgi:NAD(P)-dependent dehydrogenase (short-subunit alcohol dehydrogenase family)
MLAFGSGQVVFVGSMVTRHTFAGTEAYTAAKTGLLGFARSLSESYRRKGIRVTTVTAGAVDTDLWGGVSPPREDMLSAETVAEAIATVVGLPSDRVMEEIVVTPPKGVL